MKDDIFFVWRVDKNITIDKFKEYLNSIEPRIQFTSEIERDRVLNFADLTVKRMDDRFIMKVYRKIYQLAFECPEVGHNRSNENPYF